MGLESGSEIVVRGFRGRGNNDHKRQIGTLPLQAVLEGGGFPVRRESGKIDKDRATRECQCALSKVMRTR